MAVPEICEIDSPVDGLTVGALADGTYILAEVEVLTDPTVAVSLLLDDIEVDSGTSDIDGLITFTDVELATGANVLVAVAGTDPDTLESDEVLVTVTDVIAAIGQPTDRSAQWYLNFLAGRQVLGVPSIELLTEADAACVWAGVSVANYGLLGALNIKAGITNPLSWVNKNTALNMIASGSTRLADIRALYQICLDEQGA